MPDKEAGTIWVDVNGQSRLTTVKTTTGIGPILTQIEAVSHADWSTCWEGPIDVHTPTVSSGTYQSVQDAAVLSFETAAGSIVTLRVLGPDLSIFKADNITVDPTKIAALIAACIGTLSDGSGSAVVSYLGGFYQRSGSVLQG